MRKRHRLRLLSLAVGTTASHQKKQLPRPLGQFLVPFAMLFGVALGVGQSTEEGQGLNPRSPRGTGLSSIMHTQRKALALTKWPRLEREPKVAVDPPLARIFFPRRRSSVSSMPKTKGPSGTNASTSNLKSTQLASLLETRWHD